MTGKKIVVGITGSIAAYKACELTRILVREGCEVQVVITPAGKEFITPLTLSTLSRHRVVCDFFDRRDGSWNSHVSLGLWADVMLIAPATASTIGKMAHGIADNMLLTSTIEPVAKAVSQIAGNCTYKATTLEYKNDVLTGKILHDRLRLKVNREEMPADDFSICTDIKRKP